MCRASRRSGFRQGVGPRHARLWAARGSGPADAPLPQPRPPAHRLTRDGGSERNGQVLPSPRVELPMDGSLEKDATGACRCYRLTKPDQTVPVSSRPRSARSAGRGCSVVARATPLLLGQALALWHGLSLPAAPKRSTQSPRRCLHRSQEGDLHARMPLLRAYRMLWKTVKIRSTCRTPAVKIAKNDNLTRYMTP